ncbi:MAG TPA: hypothetical protein VH740_11675 [Vicinamibacterales bacterium]|jgi:hypothetical protein
MTLPSLHGTRMRPVRTTVSSVISRETLFEFTQEGDVVFARYAGGRIVLGALVGVRDGADVVFRYAQVDAGGSVQGGRSECTLSITATGRLQIEERFTWASDAGNGVNVLEIVE